ncbi:MAG: NAD(P)H-dependent oxidoreductase subunit E, partial [Candidatus Woesearchaeota archaeon]
MGSEFSGQKTGQRYFSSESLKDIFDEKFIEKAGNTFTHERFSDLELRIFKEASISVREAEEYSRIGGMAIVNAIRQMIPPSSILEYADHFTTDDISDLLAMYEIEYGDLIESDGEDLYDLKLHRVFGPTLPDVANKYSPIFTGAEVCILHGHGISAKQALTYNKGKIEYIDELKARDDSVRVDKGIFSGYDIVKFTEANLSPLRANRYPTYLSADEIVWLANKKISGTMAARYSRHNTKHIPFMKNHGIRPNTDPSLIQKYGLKEALYFQEHNLTEENMPCHVLGARDILETAEKCLKIKTGQTTPDYKYSLERVACLGSCAL